MITLYAPEYASVRVIECSPPSWIAHILLVEKRIPHRVAWLSFANGEHRTPEMLARNPRGTIPVIVDVPDDAPAGSAGIAVHETFGIAHYLDDQYPNPALLPAGGAERARAIVRFHESAAVKDAGMALFVALMKNAPNDAPNDAPSVADRWAAFASELAHWERYLAAGAGSAFVAGAAITLADLTVFTYLATAIRLGLDTAPFPHLARFYAAMRAREAIRATWPWPDAA